MENQEIENQEINNQEIDNQDSNNHHEISEPAVSIESEPTSVVLVDTSSQIFKNKMYDLVKEKIQDVYDPEISVNIWELGLIYEINVLEQGKIHVLMSLTSPACPAAGAMPEEIKQKVETIEGVNNCEVEVTFDPPWSQDLMSEEARLELGFM